MRCGGWSDSMPADRDVSVICKWMQNISEAETKEKYDEFDAVLYRSQVVEGLNYVVKVKVGENKYVHLMIFQSPLLEKSIETTFLRVEGGHTCEDPLEPFNTSA